MDFFLDSCCLEVSFLNFYLKSRNEFAHCLGQNEFLTVVHSPVHFSFWQSHFLPFLRNLLMALWSCRAALIPLLSLNSPALPVAASALMEQLEADTCCSVWADCRILVFRKDSSKWEKTKTTQTSPLSCFLSSWAEWKWGFGVVHDADEEWDLTVNVWTFLHTSTVGIFPNASCINSCDRNSASSSFKWFNQ